jgi:hypothetical protein
MRRRSQPARSAWFKEEFADEDLAVGIDRLNHQTQQARNLGRCRLETSPLLKRVIQFEGSQSYGAKAAFGIDLTRSPRRRNDHSLRIAAVADGTAVRGSSEGSSIIDR